MSINESIMRHPHDHIMANTWRLIFERKASSSRNQIAVQMETDFSMLEQLLPEYRLIGFSLARIRQNRYD